MNYPAEIDRAFHCIQDKAAAEAYLVNNGMSGEALKQLEAKLD